MGRNQNKFRLRRDVLVSSEMLESDAFKTLSATGIRVLLRFLQKRKWSRVKTGGRKNKIIFYDDGLVFTYAEAEALEISASQFHIVIKKLVAVGFIDVEHQGGGLARDYSRYALSDRWRDYGTDSFRVVEKRRVLQRGLDVRSRMQKTEKATENRNCQLQKTVTIAQTERFQDAGKP